MKPKRIYATERIAALRTPAKLSQFISHFETLKPGPVVLCARESSAGQKKNLPSQRTNLEWEVEKRGSWVIAVFAEIAPGWEAWRTQFGRAVLAAKEAGAVLVAESVMRFRRSWDPEWEKRRRELPLTVFDMKQLLAEIDGVCLATVVHPDATPAEVESYQTKRGQAGTGNYGGRPKEKFPKKARRLAKMPRALALRREGLSYRQIGRRLKVAWSTVRDWTEHEKTAHPAATA